MMEDSLEKSVAPIWEGPGQPPFMDVVWDNVPLERVPLAELRMRMLGGDMEAADEILRRHG